MVNIHGLPKIQYLSRVDVEAIPLEKPQWVVQTWKSGVALIGCVIFFVKTSLERGL